MDKITKLGDKLFSGYIKELATGATGAILINDGLSSTSTLVTFKEQKELLKYLKNKFPENGEDRKLPKKSDNKVVYNYYTKGSETKSS